MPAPRIKRIYDPRQRTDGCRVLVDRIWPRGVSREAAAIDHWLKELGPSTPLRLWFGHRVERWEEFVRRYRQELAGEAVQPLLHQLVDIARAGPLTLLYSARDREHNQAVVIAGAVREHLRGRMR